MPTLEEYRATWAGLRGGYEVLGHHIRDALQTEVRRAAIYAVISCRVKEMDSFLKKIIRKGYRDPIEEMHDKVGVRLVVPFVSRVPAVDAIIRRLLDVRVFEDKLQQLGEDKFAYQSWHYDVVLREPTPREFEMHRGWWCEVQLRTEAQHLWAEMAHRLLYKSEQDIPRGEARRVHRLNALLEIADYEFENTRNALSQLPGAWAAQVLSGLEGLYFELTGRLYDKELSFEVLQHLRPLCPDEPDAVIAEVRDWLVRNRPGVEFAVRAYSSYPERALFLFQPEGLLLATYLQRDPFTLRERWVQSFPEEGLSQLATVLGIPYAE